LLAQTLQPRKDKVNVRKSMELNPQILKDKVNGRVFRGFYAVGTIIGRAISR
jgi:hypothetical protein